MPLDPFVPLFMKGSMLRVSSQGQSKCERQYESLHLYNIEYIVYNEQYVTHDIYIYINICIYIRIGRKRNIGATVRCEQTVVIEQKATVRPLKP